MEVDLGASGDEKSEDVFEEALEEMMDLEDGELIEEKSEVIKIDDISKEELISEESTKNEIEVIETVEVQSEFIDGEADEAEPVVEITRRRLSHEGNCYCGRERNLNIAELLCASCHRWHHESCIGYQLGKLVPFMMNYVFLCKNCSPTGLESFKKSQAQMTQMCVTAIANLTQGSSKEGQHRKKFSVNSEIIPFIEMHWESMTTCARRSAHSWRNAIMRALLKETGSFFIKEESKKEGSSVYFSLLDLDLTQIRPNYEAMIKGGHLKLAEDSSSVLLRRGSAKRRTLFGGEDTTVSQASIAKKIRGDSFSYKTIAGHGYPTDHPFNKDGYRYYLAEPDSNAPYREEFDECSEWAGKPIPGWLYRILNPPHVLLALHDRAPQLRVSDDRLSVSGDKGYSSLRSSHYVRNGTWYWEARILDMPDSSACRLGWGQASFNLQAPLGYDKFGYSFRSRLGTKFHSAIGKTYSPGGYGGGDVVGFMIRLPERRGVGGGRRSGVQLPSSSKDKPLVRFKSHLYYEEKDEDGTEVEVGERRRGSQILFFKNGICQGVAYEDIYDGLYYPSLSLYKNCTVRVNFGPHFEAPPRTNIPYRPVEERAEESTIEQTMADLLFLTENDGQLSLDNAVVLPT